MPGKGQISVLLASGMEETDVSTITRTLRRAGFPVVIVGLTAHPVRGAYGLALAPDKTLNEVEGSEFQAVVLPGGAQGVQQLNSDPRVHALLRRVVAQGGYVLALGDADRVVQTAGVLAWGDRSPAEGNLEAVLLGRELGTIREAALALAAALGGKSP